MGGLGLPQESFPLPVPRYSKSMRRKLALALATTGNAKVVLLFG